MQTSHPTHLCLSKHAILFQTSVYVCVYLSEGELCKWPVGILLSMQGAFTPESVTD